MNKNTVELELNIQQENLRVLQDFMDTIGKNTSVDIILVQDYILLMGGGALLYSFGCC